MFFIIVDTNKYSGNFEREMCAAATGQVGDCGVGIECVDDLHPHSEWWEENIIQQTDEHGAERPVGIYTTPGYINDGMGGHYKDTSENREIAHKAAYDKMVEYQASQRAMIEKRIAEQDFEDREHGWTEEGCYRTLKSLDATLERMKSEHRMWPAYQSILITVEHRVPSDVYIDFLKRIHEFADKNDIEILDVRVHDSL